MFTIGVKQLHSKICPREFAALVIHTEKLDDYVVENGIEQLNVIVVFTD